MRHFAISVIAAGMTGISACALAACSSGTNATRTGSSPGPGTPTSASAPLSGTATVFAAASLQEAFTTIGKQFEAAHPGVHVKFSFGASSSLADQIINGAPADVFASAAPKNMQQVVNAGDASKAVNFVKNVMEVAVPPLNPARVTSVSDLAKTSVKTALCQPQVPCGATAAKVFSNAKITVKPVTQQPDVKSVLTQVELSNVDAGMVYVTDVHAAGPKVTGVPIPANVNASTEYPIAPITKTANPSLANAFVAYVLSPPGQAVLAAREFEKP